MRSANFSIGVAACVARPRQSMAAMQMFLMRVMLMCSCMVCFSPPAGSGSATADRAKLGISPVMRNLSGRNIPAEAGNIGAANSFCGSVRPRMSAFRYFCGSEVVRMAGDVYSTNKPDFNF